MNIFRRAVVSASLLAALAAGLPGAAHAAAGAKRTVDVVKIMAFSCPVCRAAEAQDPVIERAVQATGGRFVHGPLPTSAAESGAKERVYYASRSTSPQFASRVADSLYRGLQDLSIPLAELPQVFVYFQQQFPELTDQQLSQLFSAAQDKPAKQALSRAAGLAVAVGAASLPTYVIVVDGRPVAALDPESVGGGSLTVLRDEVIKRVQSYAK